MGPRHSWFAVLLVAAWLSPAPAGAFCDEGELLSDDCGFIPDVGCCVDQVLWWCDEGHLCRLDCAAISQLNCGWDANDPAGPHYECGTGGLGGPEETPLTCDSDGDGYHDVWDCAPDDPTIHPEGTEVCDDGLDNDCDEDIDGLDEDCPPGDDDTGDDDTGDDDSEDDDDQADDDGPPPGTDLQPGFLCACRTLPGVPLPLGVLSLLALAALLMSRRTT